MKRRLSDIFQPRAKEQAAQAWNKTEAAEDFMVVPPGSYVCRAVNGTLVNSKTKGTPGYRLAFKILEGDYADRLVYNDYWLTDAALPMTKRELAKIGIKDFHQLDQPLPDGIRCSIEIVRRMDDPETAWNKIRSFEVLGVDEPPPNPFAPATSAAAPETGGNASGDSHVSPSQLPPTDNPGKGG